jgi:methyl-accepting chemotaxis protein
MDTVLASAKRLSDEMQIAAKNLNTMVTEMQNRLPVLIAEFEKTLASAQDLASDAKKLSSDVQQKLPSLTDQFEKTLTSAQELASDAKKLTGNFEATLDTARELADNANQLTNKANNILRANEEDINHMIQNSRQMTIYFKSLSHVLAQRPWKLVWGFGGPLEIEAEDVKFVPPAMKESSDSVELRKLEPK